MGGWARIRRRTANRAADARFRPARSRPRRPPAARRRRLRTRPRLRKPRPRQGTGAGTDRRHSESTIVSFFTKLAAFATATLLSAAPLHAQGLAPEAVDPASAKPGLLGKI